jgi:hypothetical protein
MNGRAAPNPDWWMFALLALLYVPSLRHRPGPHGLAATAWRLTPARLRVRRRFFPGLGWTWELATGADVVVRQAYRGARENERPVMAIVVLVAG